ncbi:NAD(P)/FAD-dependent oxidoreductase [Pseudonocardia alaniniphila]|uniref:FAD-dependent oxidoreductase n=1 Tax=Pseudonocardia alaniniphila TaxID=75291 RepID=A0ABS9T877_9PSEU|nr:FAD-dependent oxidoreductase [Pseudonocardia alaniniphila]MCH6164744.1 FAD-dependent oxidoreductase [Pseudonocardia alaniniphila]
MTGQPEHVMIIGAGLGGLRTVEQLRSAGYQGRISLVGAEQHAPYDRPPLSKQILTGDWEPERTALTGLDELEDLGVRVHLGMAAVALRPGGGGTGWSPGATSGHELELSDGATLHGDAVVIATGLVARTLPGQPDSVHTLRTLDDALALRATLTQIESLLVVGGGFIGAEVASAARQLGVAVTVLEGLPVVLARALGPDVGAIAGRLLVEGGVDLRTGVKITGFTDSTGPGVGVELADGSSVSADAAVVGIGGVPRLDWLASCGLDLGNGLPCGPTGRIHGLDAGWAVGDVAAWDDPVHGERYRDEHWTSASDQAAVVARDILGAAPPPATVPYFWSDQFGLKIQLLGRPELADSVVPLHGEGFDGGPVRGTVAGYLDGDRLMAVVGFGAARTVTRYRMQVAEGATL